MVGLGGNRSAEFGGEEELESVVEEMYGYVNPSSSSIGVVIADGGVRGVIRKTTRARIVRIANGMNVRGDRILGVI